MKNYKIQTVQEYQEQKQQRNQTILQMRQDGHTLQSIANKFGCSREWIRLILKNDLDTTEKFKFNFKKHCNVDEYSANDISELTGYPFHYISKLIQKNWIPKASRIKEIHPCHKLETHFWKKTDIDKWIELKIKYLKIALEGYLQCRLTFRTEKYRCAYKFTHPNLQRRYKLLLELQSGNWKGKLSYNSKRNDEVMKEFYGYIKPFKYVPNDYSKYLNQKTNEDYAEKGLFNGWETSKILGIAMNTITKYRDRGVLKEGEHYHAGKHYFHRYMYDPQKTKKAMLDAGYDLIAAERQKERWAKSKLN